MTEDRSQLEINLAVDDDVSPLELEELTADVRRELLQLDVASVDRVSGGPAPEGAKGLPGCGSGGRPLVRRQSSGAIPGGLTRSSAAA